MVSTCNDVAYCGFNPVHGFLYLCSLVVAEVPGPQVSLKLTPGNIVRTFRFGETCGVKQRVDVRSDCRT